MNPRQGGNRSKKETEGQPQDRSVSGGSEGLGLQNHSWILQQLHQITGDIGKLSANVDRLISDVKSHGDKIDGLRNQASFLKGALAASVALIGVFVGVATFFLSSKWDAAIQALRVIVK